MTFHVETRRISARDWMWTVRGWMNEVMEFGHSRMKKDALSEGRAAKQFLEAKFKQGIKNGKPKRRTFKKFIQETTAVLQPMAVRQRKLNCLKRKKGIRDD